MRKKLLFTLFLILVIMFLLPSGNIYATQDSPILDKLNENIIKQLESLELGELDEYIQQMLNNNAFGNKSFFDKVIKILNGELNDNGGQFLEVFVSLLLSEVMSMLPILVTVAIVSILSGVIGNMLDGGLASKTNEIVYFACYSVVIIMILIGVWSLINVTISTVGSIKMTMNIILPTLITLMTAIGSVVSVKSYQPAIALLSGGVVEIITMVVLPMFIFSIIFAVISNISTNLRVNKIAEFFKSATTWIIGITFTVFTSFLAVQGLTSATIDGVSIRAAKFATKNYIPILGGYLSDGFDLILASATLIKNAIGAAGLMLLLSIILLPIVQILAYMWGLKLISALVEPVADPRIVKFTTQVSNSINILFISLLAVGFMFMLLIMFMIFTCNAIF